MAKQPAATEQSERMATLYEADTQAASSFRNELSEKEAIHVGKAYDRITATSDTFKSRVQVNRINTLALESNARVMAQLPTGVVKTLSSADAGSGRLRQLILDRYIIPNAGTQWDMLTTFRMLNGYSKVYGTMAQLIDHTVRPDGYVGPTVRLLPIRNITPQAGIHSPLELSYVFVDSYMTVRQLKRLVGKKNWDKEALTTILAKAEKAGHNRKNESTEKSTFLERNRDISLEGGKGDNAIVLLVTCYEAGEDGHWITFCSDFDNEIVRDIKNPHKTNKIPVVWKPCIPLIDSIWGLGDYERGKSLEYALNSIFNMHLDGMKMTLFPSYMVNTKEVAAMSTIKMAPGQQMLVKSMDAIKPFLVNPQGIGAFLPTWQVLNSLMLNLQGTTDTSVPGGFDPSQGRTPAAIAKNAAREATRDNWDRYFMERAIEDTYNYMLDMLDLASVKPIPVELMKEEVAMLRRAYPNDRDAGKWMNDLENAGFMEVKKEHLNPNGKNLTARFYIDGGSTIKKDQESQHVTIGDMMESMIKAGGPQTFPDIDFNEMGKRWVLTSGLDDAEKIIKNNDPQQNIVDDNGVPLSQQATVQGLPPIPGLTIPMQGNPAPNPLTPPPVVGPGELPDLTNGGLP